MILYYWLAEIFLLYDCLLLVGFTEHHIHCSVSRSSIIFFNQLHFSQFERLNEGLWWKIKSANRVQILSETVSHCTRHESILRTSYLLNSVANRVPLPSSTVMEKAIENHFAIFPKNNHGKVEFIDIKENEAVERHDLHIDETGF